MPPPDPPSPSSSTIDVDLTTAPSRPATSPPPPRSAHAFTTAHRRLYTRRERVYNRHHPHLLAERLHITEEHAPSPRPARAHLTRAYAAAAYAQSTLVVSVSLALALLVLLFARGLYADVLRKTRVRADELALHAAECAAQLRANGCADPVAASTPALAALCDRWAACDRRARFAERDAQSAAVWAEALAEVVNSFADRISSTAVVLALTAAVMLAFFMSNATFSVLHRRVEDSAAPDRGPSMTAGLLENDAHSLGETLSSPPPTNRKAIAFRNSGTPHK